MNCCNANGHCTQGENCPVRETRGQLLAAERKWGGDPGSASGSGGGHMSNREWGEMPIQFVGSEPDTDEAAENDFIKGAALVAVGVWLIFAIGSLFYFY